MSKLPRLKINMPDGYEEIHDIAEAKHIISNWGMMIVVEGQTVDSYDALVELAAQDSNKGKEFIEVTLVPFIEGG